MVCQNSSVRNSDPTCIWIDQSIYLPIKTCIHHTIWILLPTTPIDKALATQLQAKVVHEFQDVSLHRLKCCGKERRPHDQLLIGKQPRLVVCWISSICRFWPFTITTLIINIWGKVPRQPGTPHKNGGSTFRLPCHHLSSMLTPSCPQL